MLYAACHFNSPCAFLNLVAPRCSKFPNEKGLRNYLSGITEAVTAGHKKLESLSREERSVSQTKKDLFGFLPPQTKKKILLQASGNFFF